MRCISGQLFVIGAVLGVLAQAGLAWEARPAPDQPATGEELQFRELLELDDAAHQEVDRWIRDNNAFRAKGGGVPKADMNAKVRVRLRKVRQAYEEFLRQYPANVKARLAFGSFLNGINETEEAQAQWEKARDLAPENPASWNNLGNAWGKLGKPLKAFRHYTHAIKLAPNEPVYTRNLASMIYVHQEEAAGYFALSQADAVDKAIGLFRRAREHDPKNFALASDMAMAFYGTQPFRMDEALKAWETALALARPGLEKEGVQIHLTRIHLAAGHKDRAREALEKINHESLLPLKRDFLKQLSGKGNSRPTPAEKGG